MGRRRIFMPGGRRELALAVARLEAADFERWLVEGQRIRNRRFGLFVALSLVLHGLFFTMQRHDLTPPSPASPAPLNVRIVPGPEVVAELPTPEPAAKPPSTPPRPRPPVAAAPKVPPPPVIAEAPKVPVPPPEPAPESPAPPVDMLAMIEARREQRRRAQEGPGRGPPATSAPKDDPATASIKRNLASLNDRGEGVGGVFQVLRKGARTGEFAFNGWKPDRNRTWREVIEVDAGLGGDVELAMVRRMIELIRSHYTGDFQWESHRLGRVVTLSARAQDQAGLEEFLVREFFGTPGMARSR